MSTTEATLRKVFSRDLLETLFRFGLIVFLAIMCARVFAPFASLMIWGLILAVALEPLNARLAKHLGGRRGLAATILTLVGLLVLGVPPSCWETRSRPTCRNCSCCPRRYLAFAGT